MAEYSTYRLLVMAIVALALLALFFTYIAPFFSQPSTTAIEIEEQLNTSQVNLGQYTAVERFFERGEGFLGHSFEKPERTTGIVCNNTELCCEKRQNQQECSKPVRWDDREAVFFWGQDVTFSTRCREEGLFICRLYLGDEPAQLSTSNVRLTTEEVDLVAGDPVTLRYSVTNTGKKDMLGVQAIVRAYKKTLERGREVRTLKVEHRPAEFPLQVGGQVTKETSFHLPETGLYDIEVLIRERTDYTNFKKTVLELRAAGSLDIPECIPLNPESPPSLEERLAPDGSKVCRLTFFCNECLLETQCISKWEKIRPDLAGRFKTVSPTEIYVNGLPGEEGCTDEDVVTDFCSDTCGPVLPNQELRFDVGTCISPEGVEAEVNRLGLEVEDPEAFAREFFLEGRNRNVDPAVGLAFLAWGTENGGYAKATALHNPAFLPYLDLENAGFTALGEPCSAGAREGPLCKYSSWEQAIEALFNSLQVFKEKGQNTVERVLADTYVPLFSRYRSSYRNFFDDYTPASTDPLTYPNNVNLDMRSDTARLRVACLLESCYREAEFSLKTRERSTSSSLSFDKSTVDATGLQAGSGDLLLSHGRYKFQVSSFDAGTQEVQILVEADNEAILSSGFSGAGLSLDRPDQPLFEKVFLSFCDQASSSLGVNLLSACRAVPWRFSAMKAEGRAYLTEADRLDLSSACSEVTRLLGLSKGFDGCAQAISAIDAGGPPQDFYPTYLSFVCASHADAIPLACDTVNALMKKATNFFVHCGDPINSLEPQARLRPNQPGPDNPVSCDIRRVPQNINDPAPIVAEDVLHFYVPDGGVIVDDATGEVKIALRVRFRIGDGPNDFTGFSAYQSELDDIRRKQGIEVEVCNFSPDVPLPYVPPPSPPPEICVLETQAEVTPVEGLPVYKDRGLDVLLILDASISMAAEMKGLEENLRPIFTRMSAKCSGTGVANCLRMGLYVMEGAPDADAIIRNDGSIFPFTPCHTFCPREFGDDPGIVPLYIGVSDVVDGIAALRPRGNNEPWSSVLLAMLQNQEQMNWRPEAAKMAVIVTDESDDAVRDLLLATQRAQDPEDPVRVFGIWGEFNQSPEPLRQLTEQSGGGMFEYPKSDGSNPDADTLVAEAVELAISETIETEVRQTPATEQCTGRFLCRGCSLEACKQSWQEWEEVQDDLASADLSAAACPTPELCQLEVDFGIDLSFCESNPASSPPKIPSNGSTPENGTSTPLENGTATPSENGTSTPPKTGLLCEYDAKTTLTDTEGRKVRLTHGLDALFVLDASHSMEPEMQSMVNNLSTIFERMEVACERKTAEIGVTDCLRMALFVIEGQPSPDDFEGFRSCNSNYSEPGACLSSYMQPCEGSCPFGPDKGVGWISFTDSGEPLSTAIGKLMVWGQYEPWSMVTTTLLDNDKIGWRGDASKMVVIITDESDETLEFLEDDIATIKSLKAAGESLRVYGLWGEGNLPPDLPEHLERFAKESGGEFFSYTKGNALQEVAAAAEAAIDEMVREEVYEIPADARCGGDFSCSACTPEECRAQWEPVLGTAKQVTETCSADTCTFEADFADDLEVCRNQPSSPSASLACTEGLAHVITPSSTSTTKLDGIDALFVLDASRSMQPELDTVSQNIATIANNINTSCPEGIGKCFRAGLYVTEGRPTISGISQCTGTDCLFKSVPSLQLRTTNINEYHEAWHTCDRWGETGGKAYQDDVGLLPISIQYADIQYLDYVREEGGCEPWGQVIEELIDNPEVGWLDNRARVVILITDEPDDSGRYKEAAAKAASMGVKIFALWGSIEKEWVPLEFLSKKRVSCSAKPSDDYVQVSNGCWVPIPEYSPDSQVEVIDARIHDGELGDPLNGSWEVQANILPNEVSFLTRETGGRFWTYKKDEVYNIPDFIEEALSQVMQSEVTPSSACSVIYQCSGCPIEMCLASWRGQDPDIPFSQPAPLCSGEVCSFEVDYDSNPDKCVTPPTWA